MVDETLTAARDVPAPSVVLVGAAHLDRIAVSDAPFRFGASNPGRLIERLGGAAFNAAVALRAFGVEAHLVSGCGGDLVAERVSDELERFGIGDGRIAWLDRRSATYTALVDASGELVGGVADMEIYDLVTPRVLARRHLLSRFRSADGLLVDANLSKAALRFLAEREPARPIAAIAVSPAKASRLEPVLPHLAMIFASRSEIARLLGSSPDGDDRELAQAIRSTALRRAVITDGPRPVLVVEADAAWRQAPPVVEAIADVVGAGDTLAGAAFAAFLRGRSFPEAVRLGLAAASLRIGAGPDALSATRAAAIANALPAPEPIQP